MNQTESMIFFGDALKALDDKGKIGGYLVRFSKDGNRKDLSGEYFDGKTYLGSREGDGADTIFHHGQPLPVKAKLTAAGQKEIDALREHVFAPVKTKRDTIGIFAETVLDMADAYEKTVFGLVKANKLGWSSGAVGHLVKKEDDGRIARWPIGEASITPCPCEPLNRAIPIKSLDSVKFVPLEDLPTKSAQQVATDDDDESLDAHLPGQQVKSAFTVKINQIIDDLVDSGQFKNRANIVKALALETSAEANQIERILDGAARPSDAKLKGFARVLDVTYDALKDAVQKAPARSIKAIFEDALADRQFATWNLWDIYAKVVRKLAAMAVNSKATGVTFDLQGKLTEVNGEYIARLNDTVMKQIADYMENGSDDENFYLKSITDPSADVLAELRIDLDQHSQLVESAAAGVVKRFRGMHETRLKAGRVLSDKNRTRLAGLMQQMQTVMDEMQKLMDESVPMAAKSERLAAESQFLRQQARTRLTQQGVAQYVNE